MRNFDDIRPYRDAEVSDVIGSLLKKNDFFSAIAGLQLPKLKKQFPRLANKLIEKSLKKKLKGIKTIADVQEIIATYVERILATTTSGLSETGLKELSQNKSHLFISNHRDIVMDPALVSYLLHHSICGTVEIAIGDNLLKKKYISDLMRLNKSFIVKRSIQGREKLLASKQLSQYIHHSIEEGNNVWLAQREGRSKNGIDKTDPIILKMLHISNRDAVQKMTLKDSIDKLSIVPVAISYEYDPCAEMKARELYEIDEKGHFDKNETSDIKSISVGMKGNKGNIHLSFGTEIVANDNDPVNTALQIDKQIVLNYKLHPSNYLAYEKLWIEDSSIGPSLNKLNVNIKLIESKRKVFEDMHQQRPKELRPYILRMYANPVINKFQF